NKTKEIKEELEIWKKNSPFLYDILITQKLEWPSLTVQWFPQKETNQNENNITHKLLLATHTSQQENDYLLLASVTLPIEQQELQDKNQHKNYKNLIKIDKKIMHQNESNRARIMPQNAKIIASKIINGEVHIFNIDDEGMENEIKPQKKLKGHKQEGYGLQWNSQKEGYLLSGGYDKKICIWDILNQNEKPIITFQKNKECVEDVSWQKNQTNIFGSVSDDKTIMIWDLRQQQYCQVIENGHEGEIYCIDFNSFNENLFITGSEDKNVNLWDMRNLQYKMHSFEGHSQQIVRCEWNPQQQNIFSSCSYDKKVIAWDLKRCGQEIKNEDLQDGAPELLFMHSGHTEKVSDFSWNSNEEFLIASVEENNMLQVWQMNSNIYEDNDNSCF
ncbi:multicopy suppressor of ira1, putative, partial [Ichthyophthirius multifiliis]